MKIIESGIAACGGKPASTEALQGRSNSAIVERWTTPPVGATGISSLAGARNVLAPSASTTADPESNVTEVTFICFPLTRTGVGVSITILMTEARGTLTVPRQLREEQSTLEGKLLGSTSWPTSGNGKANLLSCRTPFFATSNWRQRRLLRSAP